MITRNFIQEWARYVPWQEPRQIEQDLIICHALLKIYSNQKLSQSLAFRGGTALNKIFFHPPSRYSEDIDLVQIKPEPIGQTINDLRQVMDSWMGNPKRQIKENGVKLIYSVISEDGFPIKLKLEINTREHVSFLGIYNHNFNCPSSWTRGEVKITTFYIEELLSTKLRALYQRRKGRDLYDLYIALTTLKNLDVQKLIKCFHQYMKLEGKIISKEVFIDNMETKMQNKAFCNDIFPLLPSNRIFNPQIAYNQVKDLILNKLG